LLVCGEGSECMEGGVSRCYIGAGFNDVFLYVAGV
jgi:hypothetical protein